MKQFLAREFPDNNGRLKISGREYHYIAEVRRESEGAVIHVRLPDGILRPFKIEKADRTAKVLVLSSSGLLPQEENSAQMPRIILLQWLLKTKAMDLVVRQAAETGVQTLLPVAGRRCVPSVKPGEKNPRWERIAREARQQSGSPVATEIPASVLPEKLPEALRTAEPEHGTVLRFMLSEIPGSGKTVHECIRAAQQPAKTPDRQPPAAVVAVGPEGGMTPEEREILASCGFQEIHFHTNILRAETAALYGLAAVQNAITEQATWLLNG